MLAKTHTRNALAVAVSALMLTACGDSGSSNDNNNNDDAVGTAPLTVPKVAACEPDDNPETALQGQVPAALRAEGFEGFNCNLKKVGQLQGEGGNWSSATFRDDAGQTCHYHSTATPVEGRENPGVPVIEITNPAVPIYHGSLTTPAMLDSWESLRVNNSRQILVADNGQNGGGGPEVDIYDLSADCRFPQLLSSFAVGTGDNGGIVDPGGVIGHEGNISPDGLTYYIGDITNRKYHAVDISNTRFPQLIATFDMDAIGLGVHGLSVSEDGNRMYGVTWDQNVPNSDPTTPKNGFVVFDTSEVQARKPNAEMKLLSTALYNDGSTAQHTIPIQIDDKPYLVMVDEGGSAGIQDAENNQVKTSCADDRAPFPMGRIFDMSDELNPTVVSKLMLETHDCNNVDQVLPDTVGLSIFTYGSHYCSVDNRQNATALACSYFNSGIRVFDIRDPKRPEEIAYFNPASTTAAVGSSHVRFGQWREGGPDWCASRIDFDFEREQLVTTCQNSGMHVLQFAENTWPFQESTLSWNQN